MQCLSVSYDYGLSNNLEENITFQKAEEDFKFHLSLYILLTDQTSLPDCLCFLRYWVICVLQLFVVQYVTSYTL